MADNLISFQGDHISKLVLGGAQMGMNYGIANTQGQPTQTNVNEIIKECNELNVNVIDTAQGYGESEKAIGSALGELRLRDQFHIISKLDPSKSINGFSWVIDSVNESLSHLQVDSLWGLMLHRYDWVQYLENGLGEALLNLKKEGLVKHIGVSVFNTNELESCEDIDLFSIYQVPCNLWAPDLFTQKIANRFYKKEKLVFVRSLFLQGMLLMNQEAIAAKAPFAKDASDSWHKICEELKLEPIKLCLRFAKALESPVVLGVDSKKHLQSNLSLLEESPLSQTEINDIYNKVKPNLTKKIINPYMW